MLCLPLAGPDEKGKGKAVEDDETAVELEQEQQQQELVDGEAAQAQKAARERVRWWQRLRLEGLALLADVLESAEDALGRRRPREAKQADQIERCVLAIREDLQQVCNVCSSSLLPCRC